MKKTNQPRPIQMGKPKTVATSRVRAGNTPNPNAAGDMVDQFGPVPGGVPDLVQQALSQGRISRGGTR